MQKSRGPQVAAHPKDLHVSIFCKINYEKPVSKGRLYHDLFINPPSSVVIQWQPEVANTGRNVKYKWEEVLVYQSLFDDANS